MSKVELEVKLTAPSSRSGAFSSPGKRTLVFCLLLAAVTLLVYNPANHYGFIDYDDGRYVYENHHVQAGVTWDTFKWAFTSTDQANWHPLTWLSHALDCQLFGLKPAGHHLTNILLHTLNVLLLFLLLARSTRRLVPSLFAAALFAVHPLNVESVVWVAERKNVLSTTFFLLTLAAYGWYACRPGWRRYLAVCGLLACGLASKPMLVTAPLALLLLDYWPLGRITNWSTPSEAIPVRQFSVVRLLSEKLPLLLLAAASSAITLRAQRSGGAFGLTYPLADRLKNAIGSYGAYLWKTIWPAHLALFYPYNAHSVATWKVASSALFLVAVSYAVWRSRSRRYLVVGWLWFLGTLIPVIGIVQVGSQSMADRYAYIPLIGIFVMSTWFVADWAAKPSFRLPSFVIAGVLLVALSVATYRQIGYWSDSVTVWSHTLQVTGNNWVADNNMGEALVQLNRIEDAYPYFVKSAQEAPINAVAQLNIGAYFQTHGRGQEAIAQYQLALRLPAEPTTRATAYADLGEAYFDSGDYASSRSNYEQALRLDPERVSAVRGMGRLLQEQGRWEEAARYFAFAVQLQPSAHGYLELAKALIQANHPDEAMLAWQHAVQEQPSLANLPAPRTATRQP